MTQSSSDHPLPPINDESPTAGGRDCLLGSFSRVHWLPPCPDTGADLVARLPDGGTEFSQVKRYSADRLRDHYLDETKTESIVEKSLIRLLKRWRTHVRPQAVPTRFFDVETLTIVYLSSADNEETLDKVKAALNQLGGEVVDQTDVIHGSIWQALRVAFKKTVTQQRIEEAGDYAVAAARNAVYGERQAAVTKTLAESVALLLEALKDEPTGSVLVGNLLVAKVDGVPFAMELTAAQVNTYRDRPDLQRDPAAALAALQAMKHDDCTCAIQATQVTPAEAQPAIEA